MAMLPTRRSGQNGTIADPFREFPDIYDRMGELMNLTLGDFRRAGADGIPWVPLSDVSETEDAYVVRAELPGVRLRYSGR